MHALSRIFLVPLPALSLLGCAALETVENPLAVEVSSDALIATGVVDSSTPEVLGMAIKENPSVKILVLQSVPGSADDLSNLAVARDVREAGLTTVIRSDGMIASGGTDLFLAGVQRVVEPGACIGVHSWAEGGLFTITSGREFSRDAPEHQKYLDYYREMQIDEDFYRFTLDAADFDDIYWMSASELNRFGFSTNPLEETNSESDSQRQARCNSRAE